MSDSTPLTRGKIREAFALGDEQLVSDARYQAWLALPNASEGGPDPDPGKLFALVYALAHRLELALDDAASLRTRLGAADEGTRVALRAAERIVKGRE